MIGVPEALAQSWAASVLKPPLLDAAAVIPSVLGVLLGQLVTKLGLLPSSHDHRCVAPSPVAWVNQRHRGSLQPTSGV